MGSMVDSRVTDRRMEPSVGSNQTLSNWLNGYGAFQLYHGDQLYWWKKLEYPEKTTDHC